MKFTSMRGLVVAALIAVALTGCVSMPKQQAFNREVHSNLKTVSVLETHETRTSVFMLHHPGASFGLIGGLIAAGDQASKEKRFRALMEQADFEPLAYFKERLNAHMGGRGYTLVWPQSQIQTGKVQRGPFGLRKAYPAIQTADAQLDVNFGFVGYAAAGAGDGAPYRPTVTMGVRLVSPDGKQNYYTDYLAYNNVFNMQNAIALNADARYSYPGFDDLHDAGPIAVEGLKAAIDSIAAEVARQL
ncbi:MAG TPA: hypothetical protein VIG68_08190 [Lysobacter sp.]